MSNDPTAMDRGGGPPSSPLLPADAAAEAYRRLVELVDDRALVTLDRAGRVVTWSAGAERIFGYTEDEVRGRSAALLLPEEDRAAGLHDGLLAGALRDGRVEHDCWRRARDGRRLRVHEVLAATRDGAGEPAGFASVTREVRGSDGGEKEEDLLWGEGRFHAIVEGLGEGVLIVGTDLRVLYTNPRAQEIVGYRGEELLGRSVAMLFPPHEQEAVRARAQRRLEGSYDHYQAEARRSDGQPVWVEIHSTPLRDREGRVVGAVGAFTDVTEHRLASAALARAESHYRRLVATAPQTIYALDPDGRFTELNAAGEALLGRSAGELLDRPYPRVVAPEDWPTAREVFKSVLQGERERREVELRLMRPTGEIRWAHVTLAPILEDGVIIGAHGVAHDTTEEKRTAEQFRQAQKMEAVGRLAGGVAHDFNNLLTAITGYSTLLKREVEPESQAAEFLGEIQRAAERSAELTRQLLTFSRQQVASPRVLDLNEVVRTMERILRRVIGEDLSLRFVLLAAPALVRADAGQMEQVLMNLAVNARDALAEGGEIEVSLEAVDREGLRPPPDHHAEAGRYIRLCVRDTGHGFDEQVREHLFEPFFTTKADGTGLGLPTVYGIVKQSGGFLSVDSEVGVGTTFRVHLPAVEAGEVEEAREERQETEATAGGTETLLLVEDEPGVRRLAHRVLRTGGYRVLMASNGEEALQLAEVFLDRIDLIVTDVVMPRMSGSELVERLEERNRGTRVLFISGYSDQAVPLDGGRRFLRKPFAPAQLLSAVREVLDAPFGDPSPDPAGGP